MGKLPETDSGLEQLGRELSDLDLRLLGFLIGAASVTVSHARSRLTNATRLLTTEIRDGVRDDAAQLGQVWSRQIRDVQQILQTRGLNAEGVDWEAARERSVHMLEMRIRTFIEETAWRSDSEMIQLPVDALREVLAAAGGSR